MIVNKNYVTIRLSKFWETAKYHKTSIMKTALILLCTIFVTVSARSVATLSDHGSNIAHIKQLVEQKDVSKLCTIRQELEQNSAVPNSSDLMKLLDDMAALDLGFFPSDCTRTKDIEAFEVAKENLVGLEEDKVVNTGGSKEWEKGAFVENNDQDMSKVQVSVQAVLKSDKGLDPQRPLVEVESSRVTEETDETGKALECNDCSSKSNQIPDFTATFKYSELTSTEFYTVISTTLGMALYIGIVIVLGALAIGILMLILCYCDSCSNSKSENNVESYRQNPNAF